MKKLIILLLFVLIGCSARKVDQNKTLEKTDLKSSRLSNDFLNLSKFNLHKSLDIGYTYTKEPTPYGIKETFTQNNKRLDKINIIDSVAYKYRRYKITETTYKTVKSKKTKKDAVSNWVGFTAMFFIFLLILIFNWRRLLAK
jgi:hypothetical protein